MVPWNPGILLQNDLVIFPIDEPDTPDKISLKKVSATLVIPINTHKSMAFW